MSDVADTRVRFEHDVGPGREATSHRSTLARCFSWEPVRRRTADMPTRVVAEIVVPGR